MKKAAIILTVLTLALGAVVGYELMNTRLIVTGQDQEKATSASDCPEDFQTIREQVRTNAFRGCKISDSDLDEAGDYYFQTFTIRLKNPGLIEAQMVEMQIYPMKGDVLYYTSSEEITIAPGGEGICWVRLLTESNQKTTRDFYITYYLWGQPQTMKYTYKAD